MRPEPSVSSWPKHSAVAVSHKASLTHRFGGGLVEIGRPLETQETQFPSPRTTYSLRISPPWSKGRERKMDVGEVLGKSVVCIRTQPIVSNAHAGQVVSEGSVHSAEASGAPGAGVNRALCMASLATHGARPTPRAQRPPPTTLIVSSVCRVLGHLTHLVRARAPGVCARAGPPSPTTS